MGVLVDLTSQEFGRLKVLSLDRVEKGMSYWLCVYNCNGINTKVVKRTALKVGSTQSCGCLVKGSSGVSTKLAPNEIEIRDDCGILRLFMPDGTKEFIFDLDDIDIIKDNSWYINRYGYIESRICNLYLSVKFLHR